MFLSVSKKELSTLDFLRRISIVRHIHVYNFLILKKEDNVKAFITFFLFFCVFSVVSAQSDSWVWQNPLPQGNYLTSVQALDANHVRAAGMKGSLWTGRRIFRLLRIC